VKLKGKGERVWDEINLAETKDQWLALLNTIMALLNTIMVLLNTIMVLLNTIMALLNTIMVLLNTIMALLNTIMALLNTIMALLNTIMALLDTVMALLNTVMVLLNTVMALQLVFRHRSFSRNISQKYAVTLLRCEAVTSDRSVPRFLENLCLFYTQYVGCNFV
jgi:phage-related protein